MSAHNTLVDAARSEIDTTVAGQIGTPAVIAWGPTVPTDATAGYAIGCTFAHTDGTDGSAHYINEGTATSCDFNLTVVT